MDRIKMENRFVEIRAGGVTLPGTVSLPADAHAMVIFLNARSSGRMNSQSQYIGRYLEKAGFGTLSFDLLTLSEILIDRNTGTLSSDVDLLSGRTADAIRWLMLQDYSDGIQLGFFGVGAGAAAAIANAAQQGDITRAVVSLDGQLNLAERYLPKIVVPLLAIARKEDAGMIEMNRQAFKLIQPKVPKKLEVISGKDPQWQDPAMLDQVVRLAVDWFVQYLVSGEGISNNRK